MGVEGLGEGVWMDGWMDGRDFGILGFWGWDFGWMDQLTEGPDSDEWIN